MYRGTTPTIVFRIGTNLKLETIKELWITFKTKLKEKTYTLEEVGLNLEDNTVELFMSQEDTLYFNHGNVSVQIRFLDKDDKAYATPIREIKLNDVLKEGVISGQIVTD